MMARLDGHRRGSRYLKKLALTGHRIRGNGGVVVAYREYWPGRWDASDTAGFFKITVLIADGIAHERGMVRLRRSDRTIAFVSSASSSFPAGGCVGYADRGRLKYRWVEHDEAVVDLRLRVTTVDTFDIGKKCERFKFSKRLVVRAKEVSTLTHWEGRASGRWWKESHFPQR